MAAQSKRKSEEPQAIPTTRSDKQEGVERGNTGLPDSESYRLLRQFPLPTFHPPKSVSALSGNWGHWFPQEWLQRHVRFYHNRSQVCYTGLHLWLPDILDLLHCPPRPQKWFLQPVRLGCSQYCLQSPGQRAPIPPPTAAPTWVLYRSGG